MGLKVGPGLQTAVRRGSGEATSQLRPEVEEPPCPGTLSPWEVSHWDNKSCGSLGQ